MILQFKHLHPRLTSEQIIEGMNRQKRKDELTVQHVQRRDMPDRKHMKWLAAACLMAAVVLAVILFARFQ